MGLNRMILIHGERTVSSYQPTQLSFNFVEFSTKAAHICELRQVGKDAFCLVYSWKCIIRDVKGLSRVKCFT